MGPIAYRGVGGKKINTCVFWYWTKADRLEISKMTFSFEWLWYSTGIDLFYCCFGALCDFWCIKCWDVKGGESFKMYCIWILLSLDFTLGFRRHVGISQSHALSVSPCNHSILKWKSVLKLLGPKSTTWVCLVLNQNPTSINEGRSLFVFSLALISYSAVECRPSHIWQLDKESSFTRNVNSGWISLPQHIFSHFDNTMWVSSQLQSWLPFGSIFSEI